MKSPKYGFPAHREVAAGRAPCRHCLQLVRLNQEELILFYDGCVSRSPTERRSTLTRSVYIHAEPCGRYDGDRGIPETYRGRLLTLEASDGQKVAREVRASKSQEEKIAKNYCKSRKWHTFKFAARKRAVSCFVWSETKGRQIC